MKALIADWRSKWHAAGPAPTRGDDPLSTFPFIVHQLSAYTGSAGIMGVRWGQYNAAYDADAPPAVGLTVGIDLADPTSPCGNVHIRNKTAVGARTALAARALAYGEKRLAFSGPVARGFSGAAGKLTVAFDVDKGGAPTAGEPLLLQLRTINQTTNASDAGFEVTKDCTFTESSWARAPAMLRAAEGAVELDLAALGGEAVCGVRYLWADTWHGSFLYNSAGLPASPFLARCGGGTGGCELVPGAPAPPTPPPTPPAPPTPAPTLPPQPPLPASSNCTWQNETEYGDATYSQLDVALWDFEQCCALCKADAKCAVASLHHGSASAPFFWCELKATKDNPRTVKTKGEELSVSCAPR